MDKNKITFFIVSNQSGQTRKLVIPARLAKIVSTFGILILMTLVAGVIDYLGLLYQTSENKRLKAENAQLTKQFQIVEGKISSLETSLERVTTFTTKIKLITNIESEDRSMKLAMPTQPPANQAIEEFDQPIDQRESSADLEKMDQEFQDKKPLNETQGELAENSGRDYQSLVIRVERAIKESQLREQSVLDLWETISEKQSLMNAIPNIRPARGWITSRFGYRVSPFTGRPSLHTGLDIAAAPGAPIFGPADGLVTFAGYDEGYGKMVTIDHGHGYQTRYGHLAHFYVQVGQRVNRWDIIASVGNTGRSTGPHLHYEVRLNGVPKNPAFFILDE